jgi:hypothetical protein
MSEQKTTAEILRLWQVEQNRKEEIKPEDLKKPEMPQENNEQPRRKQRGIKNYKNIIFRGKPRGIEPKEIKDVFRDIFKR